MTDVKERLAGLSAEQRSRLVQGLSKRRGTTAPAKTKKVIPTADNFCCGLATPGNFNGITFQPLEITPPGPGQVRIRARAVSLNFRDLMIAMHMYPAAPGVPSIMGSDYAGEVTACGEGVSQFKPGDRVMALSAGDLNPSGGIIDNRHFCAETNLSSHQVVPISDNISFEEAAGIPTVFLTSFYALHHLARLKAGERVLIHTATGGVGLAAMQIAHWKGAEIYTTAGSETKRSFLQAQGIKQPMNSRTTDFAKQILTQTQGEGVDVILNTLSGEAVQKGLEVLSMFGRFLQIGKHDVSNNNALDLAPFVKGLSFSVIDLSLFALHPDRLQTLMLELSNHFRDGHLKPIHHTTYPVSKLGEALTFMSHSKHIGKIVLNFDQRSS